MNNAKKDFRIIILVSLCLIIGIMVAYGQVRTYDFVRYDDQEYVFEKLVVFLDSNYQKLFACSVCFL